MSGFVLTNKALNDLKEIGHYTERMWGKEQRNNYLSILDRCFQDLASAPLKGQDCNAVRSGYRKHPTGKHLVFYRMLTQDQIEIVRILHARMDVERHFDERCAETPDQSLG
ncbi:MAG: type II toxin-antitoxin system RelE/ParE family toxin [Magnetococcales bacterium]|nr:type II toxin-antitoxin system RelE/ParE family toxin [Magnetococcales bacterium]